MIKPTVTFGYHVAMDNGQSGKTGSTKIGIFPSNWGKPIAYVKAKEVLGNQPLSSADAYVVGLKERIKQAREIAIATNELKNDEKLESITIVTSGAPNLDGTIAVCGNLWLNGNPETPMKDVALGKLPQLLQTDKIPLAKSAEELKKQMTVLNDMAGGTSVAAKVLEKIIKPGETWTYIMPGSGLGVARVQNNGYGMKPGEGNIELTLTELGHMYVSTLPDGSTETLESHGASATGLTQVFTDSLKGKYGENELNSIRSKKDAQSVTDFEYAQKNIPNLKLADFKTASLPAINKFVDAIVQSGQIALSSSNNGVIIAKTDSLLGVSDYMKRFNQAFRKDIEGYNTLANEHPELKLPKNVNVFQKTVISRLWNRLDSVLQGQYKNLNFEFKYIDDLKDNVKGAPYLQQGNPFNSYNTRFVMPQHAFKAPLVTLPELKELQ